MDTGIRFGTYFSEPNSIQIAGIFCCAEKLSPHRTTKPSMNSRHPLKQFYTVKDAAIALSVSQKTTEKTDSERGY